MMHGILGLLCLLWRLAMGQDDNVVIHGPGLYRAMASGTLTLDWRVNGLNLTACGLEIKLGADWICMKQGGQFKTHTNFSSYSCSTTDDTVTLTMWDNFETATKHNITLAINSTEKKYTNSASLFIYRKPEVRIEVPPDITEGGTYNISCIVSLTSLPEWARLSVNITWDVPQSLTHHNVTADRLTVYNVKQTDDHINCTAREDGSPLASTATTHIYIQSKAIEVTTIADGFTSGVPVVLAKSMLIGLVVGAAVTIFLLAIIGYLLWERKHRPVRQKERSKAIRHSLGRPFSHLRQRYSTNHLDVSITSSDSDSNHLYSEICTPVTQAPVAMIAPEPPRRDPPYRPPAGLTYEYADARLLNTKAGEKALGTSTEPDNPEAPDILSHADPDKCLLGDYYSQAKKPRMSNDNDIVECPAYTYFDGDNLNGGDKLSTSDKSNEDSDESDMDEKSHKDSDMDVKNNEDGDESDMYEKSHSDNNGSVIYEKSRKDSNNSDIKNNITDTVYIDQEHCVAGGYALAGHLC